MKYNYDDLQYKNLYIYQDKNGYKSSEASIILQDVILENIEPQFKGKIFEFGTGNGIISILLAAKLTRINIYAIEVQKSLYQTAKLNIKNCCFDNRIRLIKLDGRNVKQGLKKGSFDSAFANPPFFPKKKSRISPISQKRFARNELLCEMEDVINAFSYVLKKNSSAFVIYPSFRFKEFNNKIRHHRKKFIIRKFRFFKGLKKEIKISDKYLNLEKDYQEIEKQCDLFVANLIKI